MPADPSKRLHPQAYDALAEGLATFQWYKPPFSQMMTSPPNSTTDPAND